MKVTLEMSRTSETLERSGGVALWRQIADRIRSGLGSEFGRDGRIPPEATLAEMFGVNRHTVRSAIQSLVAEGVLRAERGRGTFVVGSRKFAYPIGRKTRFSEGLEGQAETRITTSLGASIEVAGTTIAATLGLAAGASVIRQETLSLADATPISRATHWFDADRFAEIGDHFSETQSITAALKRCGVADYHRRETRIEARHANDEDRTTLRLSPGAIVLVAHAVNAEPDGTAIQVSITRFAADRVDLVVGAQKAE